LTATARMVAVSMIDEVSNAFEAFVRRWAERQGLFEQRTHRRMLELVVMPGQDVRALNVARHRGVPRVGASHDPNRARPSARPAPHLAVHMGRGRVPTGG
jgi:hypothetical protein